MKPDHVIRLSLKKRPMTAAERARKYRERRKLKLLGASTNLLEQTLNTSNALILPEELTNGENESWSKDTSEYQSDMDAENIICSNQKKEILETPENTGIVIEIESGLTDYISQDDVSKDDMTKNSIPRCSILKEAASHLEDLMIEVNHRTSSYQEEVGNYQNSENADNKDHSSAIKSHSSVEESSNNEKAAKKGANKQKNYSTNMCDQQQVLNIDILIGSNKKNPQKQ
ncbi:unnamed protein product [Nezara viridula]|uniref:Uncharacterized protein n=1 Tax=Nezara viridula TaxID=85310 RepID=A0A9P0H7X1_NEZVI|nr:unnamed protein product [Nezara viridula]